MKSEFEPQPEPAAPLLPRRSVLVAGAWSVPVIALATATPAMAASTPSQISLLNSVFDDVEEGDTFPLVFEVTDADEGTGATATLLGATGVAEWSTGGTVALAAVDGGQVIFVATALGSGEFQVTVAIGGFSRTFPVEVTVAAP